MKLKTEYYNVFVRNWWRMERGRRVPDPGARKTYLRKHVTYEDARAICEAYKAEHDPGQLSRKAEFEAA
jgi:hypothetical protein